MVEYLWPPKKYLGQHWLNDQKSLEAMCQAADVQPGDTVLEIGPGLGSLTTHLVQRAGQVVAVEYDAILARTLSSKVTATNLSVITGDILSFDFTSLPSGYKVVANIPYYLTSHLVRFISETTNPPDTAVLLVQKEVAQRIAAQPGAMSILSITAQYYWQVSLGHDVPAKLFKPPPKVDSQIVILKRNPTRLLPDINTKDFFRLVKAGFAQRRKTLLNSLSAGLRINRIEAENLCKAADIDPKRRAQTLSLNDWHNLYQVFYS